jgi:uncharacterized protein (TIGR00251 family)
VAAGHRVDVRVTPRAGRTAFVGVREGRLQVRLAAAPIDGAANDALIRAIAATLGLAPRRVRVVIGERNRNKTIEISGCDAMTIRRRLTEAIA